MYIVVGVINDQPHNVAPDIEVTICLDEGPDINKQQLTRMFTIGNIIPNISKITHTRHL